jgi:LacI family transcriptional regulator
VLFPPTGVITRQSSDLTAIGDPDVAAAVTFIREHAEEPIGVADILKVVPISRRALEQRFAATVGRSPHQELRRARLELARQLLLTSETKLREVAEKCGFFDLSNFTQAFRLHTGYTPAAYRRSFRQQ